MEAFFKSYCSFGDKDAAPLMDNAKFAKMSRDTKILDKKLTPTDIDIIFSKVKGYENTKIFLLDQRELPFKDVSI